jgi:hypothetical protein
MAASTGGARMSNGSGPAWVGIGAQRSGTTWFTEMLCRHPQVALPPGERDREDGGKEVHFFDRFGADLWTPAHGAAYRGLFPRGRCSGEFTPAYLRCPWVPSLLRASCDEEPVIFVLLRDPVERYRSAMRWYAGRPGVPARGDERAFRRWARARGADAAWGGLYAAQLDAWTAVFARDRIVVVQYERLLADPAAEMGRAWRALALEAPPPDAAATTRTWNSTAGGRTASEPPAAPAASPGLEPSLRALYARDAARCAAEWGIDGGLWPTLTTR